MKFMNQDFVNFATDIARRVKGEIGVCEITGLFRTPLERRLRLGAMMHEMSIFVKVGTVFVRYQYGAECRANVEFYSSTRPDLANDGKYFQFSDAAGAAAYIGEEMERYGRP